MPCVCNNTALRLFIRNVTQLDLPIAGKLPASKHLSRRQLPALKYAHASRPYSSEAIPQYRDHSEELSNDSTAESLRSQLSSIDNDAFVDFSSEAIDAIAAEAASERAGLGRVKAKVQDLKPSQEQDTYDTPWRSLQRDMPQRREREGRVRGDKVQGLDMKGRQPRADDFKLRYSAAPDWQKVEDHGERLRLKMERNATVEASGKAKDEWEPPPREPWMVAKERVKEKYPDGWNPLKRLSPDAIAGIRALHAQMPEQCTPWVLANEFKVSQEAIQRILKTRWRPNPEEQTDREERWHKRGERIWSRLADMGHKPPAEWRELGIGAGKPDWMKARANPRPRAPLPALITTARRKEARTKPVKARAESLADQII